MVVENWYQEIEEYHWWGGEPPLLLPPPPPPVPPPFLLRRTFEVNEFEANHNEYYDELEHEDEQEHQSTWSHFTQVIWKGSHYIDIGCSIGVKEEGYEIGEGDFVVVANYYPPGNVPGMFASNVAPLIVGDNDHQ